MRDIAIVTDSTADIPPELLEKHDIHVIPNYVIIAGKSYADGQEISRREFYETLPNMDPIPTTAAASSGEYQNLYESLFQRGANQIISIHCSSLLSGIYNAARLAAEAFGDRVHVIDSQYVTLGLGFQVLAAAEASIAHPVERILEQITEVRRRVRVIAMLDTLEYVRRGGRISWARARIGDLLSLKAFVEVREGHVISLGESRTRHKGMNRLIEMIRDMGALDRLAILHSNAEDDARHILQQLAVKPPLEPFLVNVTTVIGTHVGPNGLGTAAVVKA